MHTILNDTGHNRYLAFWNYSFRLFDSVASFRNAFFCTTGQCILNDLRNWEEKRYSCYFQVLWLEYLTAFRHSLT